MALTPQLNAFTGKYLSDPFTSASFGSTGASSGSGSTALSNAADSANSYLGSANSAIGSSITASQSGVSAAEAAAANALAAQTANASQVRMINTDAEAMRTQAGRVSGIASGMAQDTTALRGDAQTLRGNAANLWGQGQGWFTTGSDIVNLNPNATGIAGEFGKYYTSLSPDSLVSFAASDAQRSVNNTRDQLVRTLSGMGVSPGSGAFGAALAKTRQYEAALLAGVKSRARLLGIDKQGAALTQGMQMAVNATGLGRDLANAAVSATQGAAATQGRAADVEATRGQLETSAANIRQGAGGLAATGANINTQSANAYTSAQSAVSGAYDSLTRAQQTAADYYSTQASSVLGLLQSGNSLALNALFT